MLPRTRIRLAIWMMLLTGMNSLFAQHLSSARTIAIGASTAPTQDLGSLDWNPAALIRVKDWQVMTTNYYSFWGADRSMVLQFAGIGKRFLDNHAAAFRFSPGMTLEFIVPSTITIQDSTSSLITTFDKKIHYQERYALGYAVRPQSEVAIGFSLHFLEEHISDTKYSLDTNSVIRASQVEYNGNVWTMDWGFHWSINPTIMVGVAAKNLFRITEQGLDKSVQELQLRTPKFLVAGIANNIGENFLVAVDVGTNNKLRIGSEWKPASAYFVRGGWYANWDDSFTSEAISIGAGVSFHPLSVDVSYLLFTSGENRQGTADLSRFITHGVSNLDINPFTANRLSLSVIVDVGKIRETLVRIDYVEMLGDVFPSSATLYAFRPLGKARVRNVSEKSIVAKVSFYVNQFMNEPTESKPYTILPGETIEIPFYAIFNQAIRTVNSLLIQNGDVYVQASATEDYDDKYQTKVLVRGRNDWNGDITTLKFFLTPDDPEILRYTRSALEKSKRYLDTVPSVLQKFEKARLLFNDFASRMQYVDDPKKSQDHVQYPSETLTLHGGDCDDMTVCFATILGSIGIETAFIDVVPPDHPENAHVYLMFNTEVKPQDAWMLSDNPKRFIVRGKNDSTESVWLPLELTSLKEGFSEAWARGAQEYYTDVEIKLGLAKGWVRIVDVQPAY
jgi:hypothetical protein